MKLSVACVTGATGMIGKRIVSWLLDEGYEVRILSRKQLKIPAGIKVFRGDIVDSVVLDQFLHGAQMLFHCAAELQNQSLMWKVNVEGTKLLIESAYKSNLKYFCHVSSAGVIGATQQKWVDEMTPCNPGDSYEKSKWAAEQLVMMGIPGCKVVVLRPTNVIDEDKPGALALPQQDSWKEWIQVFIKGGECAHIIHAEDVAAAAIYFISKPVEHPECFFVANDDHKLNTFAGLWDLYRAILKGNRTEISTKRWHLPVAVPYLLRKLLRGKSNMGDVRYSSKKIESEGFKFQVGVDGAVQRIVSYRRVDDESTKR
ncbi:ADP-L-glycero-D-manno-heptose-6-epimerase [Sporomusa silvacetica DSM 10669]|uniref:ADP-L-glycero-D-manno-heptose-6-epimerase n=1 Tax=Sporomusa silvacetica DSM 10669 TaxID=1123289 RepID=A0ABZ3IQR9_9FIRM|nr:NAD(P)-dependent oxidoreductase [Sporomusa silvacetica]OZC20538.1 3 beta-hydroxysteroid dehydrogenase/delta 5-->4-isomerase [Sporomusa silvacetica DSM 10669]